MNWNELPNTWKQSEEKQPMELSIDALQHRERTTHRRVRRRDLLETVVAIPLAVFFAAAGVILLKKGVWLSGAAALWLTASCIYIPWRLREARKLLPVLRPETPTLEYLRCERDALHAQYELLNGILRWYLGPLGVGVLAFYAGIKGWSSDTAWYTAAVTGLYGLIYLGNRAAAQKRIKPLIAEVEQHISQLEHTQ